MIIDKAFFEKILPQIDGFNNLEEQLHTFIGFDEAVNIVENIRNVSFPCVLFEEMNDGYITFNDGYCDDRVVSFWVVCKGSLVVDERKAAYEKAYKIGIEIMKHIVAANKGYSGSGDWFDNYATTRYYRRGPLAGDVFGYEFAITIRREMGLELGK